jgi:hypothetical protein
VSREGIVRALEALASQHEGSRDGGDRLVRAVIQYGDALPADDRFELRQHLLDLVDREEPEVWPVALEVLVRTGSAESSALFIPLLASDDRSPEWSEAVVVAMMRLGSVEQLGLYCEYVREELRMHHASVLPMLGWLYRTDLEFALPLAARFFAETLSGAEEDAAMESARAIRARIDGQVTGLLAHSTGAVLDLLDQVAALDAAAGRALAAMILEVISRPGAPRFFGRRAVASLGPALRLRAAS